MEPQAKPSVVLFPCHLRSKHGADAADGKKDILIICLRETVMPCTGLVIVKAAGLNLELADERCVGKTS